jgi:RNA polymerase sigma-70 factor (ECF subfamily)
LDADLGETGRSALVAAYVDHRKDLVRFFARRLRSEVAAEDLVQEVYLRIARVDEDARIESPLSYLYRLGSNLMLDQIRGERRSAAREAAWTEARATRLGQAAIAEETAADDALAARQRLSAIVQAVRELPAPAQEVFRLHKLQGLSHAETAARLGVSRSSVEKRMIAVLKHLANQLGADLGEADGGGRGAAASSDRACAADGRRKG